MVERATSIKPITTPFFKPMSSRSLSGILPLLSAIWLTACQSINDLQPQPDALPASVVQLLKDEFPGYEVITVSPLEKDRVWNARLTVAADQYDLVVSRQKILSRFRLLGEQMPDGLMKEVSRTVLDGGKFSDFRERKRKIGEFPDKEFSARYSWKDWEFFTDWTSLIPMSGRVDFYPDVDVKYYTEDQNDLPEGIQQIIGRKISEARLDSKNPRLLEFNNARVYNYKTQKKSYEVDFLGTKLEIGPDGQIIFWDFDEGLNNGFEVLLDRADLPEGIISYLNKDLIANTFPGFIATRFKDNEKKGYRVILSKDRISYIMYFDEKNTLVRHYFEKYV